MVEIIRPSPLCLPVEIKPGRHMKRYPGIEKGALSVVASGGMRQRCIASSFVLGILDSAAQIDPDVPRLWLISPNVQHCLEIGDLMRSARAHGVERLSFNVDHCDVELFGRCRHEGFSVGAWGAHRPEQIRKALALDCDVFTTDDPVCALAMRGGTADAARGDA